MISMAWRVALVVVFVGAVIGSSTMFCGGCYNGVQNGGVQAPGPAGFHVACFDINGKPYINVVGTGWKGDVDGVFTITMDSGLKATMHGDRCLVEEVSAAQWSEIHKPSPTPVPTPAPSPPPAQTPDAGPAKTPKK